MGSDNCLRGSKCPLGKSCAGSYGLRAIKECDQRSNSFVSFSIPASVILISGSSLDRNQEYLPRIFLDRLPSC